MDSVSPASLWTGRLVGLWIVLAGTSGCISISISETRGGGGDDASSCISIVQADADDEDSTIKNGCAVAINFVEFSTGGGAIILLDGLSEYVQAGRILGWGACVAPAVPQRVEDFDYICAK